MNINKINNELKSIIKEYISSEKQVRTSSYFKINGKKLSAECFVENILPVTVDLEIMFKLKYITEKLLTDYGNYDKVIKTENDIRQERERAWNIQKQHLVGIKKKKELENSPSLKSTMDPIKLRQLKIEFDKETDEIVSDAIKKIPVKRVKFEDFYYDVLSKHLSDRNLLLKGRKLSNNDFNLQFVISDSDSSLNTLDPNKPTVPRYTITFSFEAKDKNKNFEKNYLEKLFSSVLKEIENELLYDTEYYTIGK